MVGFIFQNWFFSILTAKDRAKGIQRGNIRELVVSIPKKEQDETI